MHTAVWVYISLCKNEQPLAAYHAVPMTSAWDRFTIDHVTIQVDWLGKDAGGASAAKRHAPILAVRLGLARGTFMLPVSLLFTGIVNGNSSADRLRRWRIVVTDCCGADDCRGGGDEWKSETSAGGDPCVF